MADIKIPKVSIILPTYNGAKYLDRSLKSCLGQTYRDFELIIVDDASPDNTAGIINSYQDERIRYIRHKKNKRLPRALNTGLANARGEYITWTSDDNEFLPNAIEEMLNCLKNNKEADLVFTDYWAHYLETGEKVLRRFPDHPNLKLENQIGTCFLFTRRAFEGTGYYDPKYELVEDYEYWIRMCDKFKAVHYPHPLYIYGEHSKSLKGTRLDAIVLFDRILKYKYGYFSLPSLKDQIAHYFQLVKWQNKTRDALCAYKKVIVKISRISLPLGILSFRILLAQALRKVIKHKPRTGDRKICILTETIGFGGTEVHTLELMKFLVARDYYIELVSCRHNQYDEKVKNISLDKIKVIHTDLGVTDLKNNMNGRWRAFLPTLESDILIFPKGHNDMGTLGFLWACRKNFKKVYYIEHLEAKEMPPKTSKKWLGGKIRGLGLWWYKEKAVKKARSYFADKIVAVSDGVANRLINDCRYPAGKITVIQNGVRWKEFSRDEEKNKKFRQEHQIPENAFIFGMITRLNMIKGIDIALHALQLLLKMDVKKPVYLVIAGDGEEKDKFTTITATLGLEQNVKFLGFITKPQEVYSAYDAIFFPSRREGLPLGLLEAMATGCVPVVSDIGGMMEVVNSYAIGWVEKNEDIEGFAKAMYGATQLTAEELNTRRNIAVYRVKENFDLDKSHQKLFAVLGL